MVDQSSVFIVNRDFQMCLNYINMNIQRAGIPDRGQL